MNIKRLFNALFRIISTMRLRTLAVLYVAGFLVVEEFVPDVIRHYNFGVLLALSGIFFAWLVGGKRTMYYVAFFNTFLVFVFSSILWNKGIIIHSGLFVARAFITIYILAALIAFVMLLRKSPADERSEAQQRAIEEARRRHQNLEFMVASKKLKQDLLAQANAVKDELLILEGVWRSKIHDIINDLPDVKERELYGQIIAPFQEKIISHLRDLAKHLTFELEPVTLDALHGFLKEKVDAYRGSISSGHQITYEDTGWQSCNRQTFIDKQKLWDMLLNIIRNSQAALDRKRIELLRNGTVQQFIPQIKICTAHTDGEALVTVLDNAGGVPPDTLKMLYREPVVSAKRTSATPGQGTMFVKFFAERMNLSVGADMTTLLGEPGLAVNIKLPVAAG
ncbi:MAG: histidine kinase [Desulfobacterota bacterium]|nr:histidine kinase [Thermodesulfobacteriota bacterium]